MLDAAGSRLTAAHLLASASSGCRCHDSGSEVFVAEARLAEVADGTTLRIERDGEEVWRSEAPDDRPSVDSFTAAVDRDGAHLLCRWRATPDGQDSTSFWLRWSFPDSERWHALAVDLQDGRARVPLEGLPGGDVNVELVMHDGFFSVHSRPVRVDVPAAPVRLDVTSPRAGMSIAADSTLRLSVHVHAPRAPSIPADALRWSIDGRSVGEGLEVFVEAPAPGHHRCEVVVDHDRVAASASTTFHIETTSQSERREADPER